ncbi:MAG: hypothetical protein WCQ63_00645 [Methanomethylophilus sp.]|nr:hypothetical protein [Methanomethylophilus sp.]MDD4668598.1 hypothetical protein [Methanomethylophilus sp.]
MSDRIFVIETITDGEAGFPYDEILSIGVCSVDVDAGDFDSVYHANIYYDPRHLGRSKLDYAEARGLKIAEIYDGIPEVQAAKELKGVIRGQYVTSYDIRQEFTKYLVNDPWDVTLETHIMPSVMIRQSISLRCKTPGDEPGIIVKAYRRTFRNDPANVGRDRSALALAQMTAQLLLDLRARGKY